MEKQTVETVEKSSSELIADMVAEYNVAEAIQAERLRALFYAIKAGGGMRKVRFANGEMWANCWGNPDRRDHNLHLHRSDRQIIEFVYPG
ncbi:MAG: hypothetical protein Q7U74_16145 [Saprospiraceae bacterium]|nr:hypothetical protein [Saprospiraceae bacterium]